MSWHGYSVCLLESHTSPGGAAHGFERGGYSFETGPSFHAGLSPGASSASPQANTRLPPALVACALFPLSPRPFPPIPTIVFMLPPIRAYISMALELPPVLEAPTPYWPPEAFIWRRIIAAGSMASGPQRQSASAKRLALRKIGVWRLGECRNRSRNASCAYVNQHRHSASALTHRDVQNCDFETEIYHYYTALLLVILLLPLLLSLLE